MRGWVAIKENERESGVREEEGHRKSGKNRGEKKDVKRGRGKERVRGFWEREIEGDGEGERFGKARVAQKMKQNRGEGGR